MKIFSYLCKEIYNAIQILLEQKIAAIMITFQTLNVHNPQTQNAHRLSNFAITNYNFSRAPLRYYLHANTITNTNQKPNF